ncbi:MAG: hypothetical protein ACOX6T_08980 [Myxococcales bacterium]|jgi:hypothetical protein
MSIDRYRRSERAKEHAGAPLGGGLDEQPAPARGRATIGDLRIVKPAQVGGERGLQVVFVVHAEDLGGARLVVETTLHEQGRGPFRTGVARLADSQGLLNVFEVVTPPDDGHFARECSTFVPFAALEPEHAGTLRCFARVRLLEEARGALAEEEAAFELQAG